MTHRTMSSGKAAGPRATGAVNRAGRALRKDYHRYKGVYLLLIPVVAYYIIFHYIPLFGTQIAFKDYQIGKGILGSDWVGFKHFITYFNSYYFFRLIRNTFLISFYYILLGFPAPILLALLICEIRNTRFRRLVQTTTYLPHFISIVVVCGLMVDFFAVDGLINQIFGTDINFFMEADAFRPLYIGSGIWQEVGWGSIVYIAAIMGIDEQLYEAASIDGAGRLKQILHITLPCLIPTIVVMLTMRIGRMMTVGADKILLMYNPSTYVTADVISTFVYRKGLLEANFSYSAAVDLVNSVINCVLLVLTNKLCRRFTGSSLY